MPELPEVEYAASIARPVAEGRTIGRVQVLHRAQRRTFPPASAKRVAGDRVDRLERRGKYQLLHLASRRTILVHFRMNGDWAVMPPGGPVPPHARVVITFNRGHALALVDSRALATITLHEPDEHLLRDLGPEANTPAFNTTWLGAWFANKRGPVKPALLDQRAVAGIGNIYASEALWYARIDPRIAAGRLTKPQLAALVQGVKRAMRKALDHPERYYGATAVSDAVRFNVYDREGAKCRRCGTAIRRTVQAGRSTYWCGACARG